MSGASEDRQKRGEGAASGEFYKGLVRAVGKPGRHRRALGASSRTTDKWQQNLPMSPGERRGDDGGIGCAGVAIKGDRAGVDRGEEGRADGGCGAAFGDVKAHGLSERLNRGVVVGRELGEGCGERKVAAFGERESMGRIRRGTRREADG